MRESQAESKATRKPKPNILSCRVRVPKGAGGKVITKSVARGTKESELRQEQEQEPYLLQDASRQSKLTQMSWADPIPGA